MTVAACGTGQEFLCLMACSREPEPTETREQVLDWIFVASMPPKWCQDIVLPHYGHYTQWPMLKRRQTRNTGLKSE